MSDNANPSVPPVLGADLEQLQVRFRHLIESLVDWYWEIDASYRYRQLSGAPRADPELDPNALIGQPWDSVGSIPVEIGAEGFVALLDRREPFRDILFSRVRASGAPVYSLVSGIPLFDATGAFTGYHGVVRDVTEQKSAERALALSEQRFRDFSRASGDWMSETDPDGRYTWVSSLVAAKRGVAPEWFIGRRRIDLADADADPSREPWRSHLETLARHEPFREFRYVSDGAAGHAVISVSGVPMFDPQGRFTGYRNIAFDATERVAIEERARNAQELLRAAVENLDQGVVLCDASDRIVFCNALFRRWHAQIEPAIAPGTPYETYLRTVIRLDDVPVEEGREDAWVAERLAQRRHAPNRFERQRAPGIWQLVSDTPLPGGGLITFILDISDRKNAEAKRDDEVRAQRNALVREVHHRIKNNLQGMAGLLGLRAAGQPETAPALQEAMRQIHAIARVHGMYGHGRDRISLAALVADVVSAMPGLRGVEASLDPGSVGGEWLLGERDAVPVALVANELVWNAIKHADPAAPDPVRVALVRAAGDLARLLVRNRGRLDHPAADAARSGVGLGLMRTLLQEHAGAIELAQRGDEVVAVLELRTPAATWHAANPRAPARG